VFSVNWSCKLKWEGTHTVSFPSLLLWLRTVVAFLFAFVFLLMTQFAISTTMHYITYTPYVDDGGVFVYVRSLMGQ
jgi:hypothetical protein